MLYLRQVEIENYYNQMNFLYDIYKSNKRNYNTTLNFINVISDDNKLLEDYHKNLLDIIFIDNKKDEINNLINNRNIIRSPIDNDLYFENFMKIYKEFIKNNLNFNELIDLIINSIIIIIKIDKNIYSYLIKFNDIQFNPSQLKIIVDNDYTNDNCLICLEDIKKVKQFRIFNCCLSKSCSVCYKEYENKCPVCNQKSKTFISFR